MLLFQLMVATLLFIDGDPKGTASDWGDATFTEPTIGQVSIILEHQKSLMDTLVILLRRKCTRS